MATLQINDRDLRNATEGSLLLLLEGLVAVKNSAVNPRREIALVTKIDVGTLHKAVSDETYIGIKRWITICQHYPWFEQVFLKWFTMIRTEIEP